MGSEVGLKRERPVLTSDMSEEQKKAVLEEYMLKCGYNKYLAEDVIDEIPWSEVTDDFAPSFYAALEKGYIWEYISIYSCSGYYTNEKIMSQMNKVIERMVSKGYSKDDIGDTIYYYISYSEVKEDLAPSFYTALEKGYIGKYMSLRSYCKYFTDETIMSNMNKVVDLMVSKGYSKDDIAKTTRYLSWAEVKEDLAPSFYAALEKGYIEKYISTWNLRKYLTDEVAMANINNYIDFMIASGKSKDIKTKLKHINSYTLSQPATGEEISYAIKKNISKEREANKDLAISVVSGVASIPLVALAWVTVVPAFFLAIMIFGI